MAKTLDKDKEKYMVQYGEPVGMIAAQSVGEPGTQMILRSFHLAGIESTISTSGLPRIVELVDAKKKPATPVTYIYLNKSISKSFDKADEMQKKINEVVMSNITRRTIENFTKGTIRFLFNRQELELEGLSPKQVATRLEKHLEVDAKAEDEKSVTVHMHTKNLKLIRATTVKILKSVISGIEGAGKVMIRKDEKTDEFYLVAAGSNMEGIINVDGIDKSRITTNDIFSVYRLFGVEAARNALAMELKKTLDEQKISVNQRHLYLISDAMTASGTPKGVGRHGLSGEKNSVFARAAYEETVKHLIHAAAYGEVDPMKGVTENILVGKQIPIGTGSVRLTIKKEDMAKIKSKKD
ncbi:MAG: DNA-directed RNA polymerase subunit A'' [Candidatus Micrarchaeota archaeon]|nr:DNA-directed RNA polymerase subunit A'' [Candidatus Micrarchaeota archaeon]